jgi:hypothetical protein
MKLRETISLDFQGTPLSVAMQEVGEMIGVTIALDTVGLGEVGVDPNTPVKIGGEMSVREFFRRSLKSIESAPTGLAYTVNESNIEITPLESAEPAIRYYDLAYILPNDSHLLSVVSAIEQSISPDSWAPNGGTNTISSVGSMLIISCDEPSHHKIEMMLSRIATINKMNLEKASPQKPLPAFQGMGGLGGGTGGMGGGGMF